MTDSGRPEESARGPVRKFNPGTLQSDAEIVEQFAVRRTELGILLDIVRGNLDRASCQHALVVAPRGRGKTMVLARVAAELRANEEFCESLIPVRFMEESHEIVDVGGLLAGGAVSPGAGDCYGTPRGGGGNCAQRTRRSASGGASRGSPIWPAPPCSTRRIG